jgi:N-acetylglucosaminyldiphosphoundecaprenol N-acetyl-beta-D-mannosaminyltransferase
MGSAPQLSNIVSHRLSIRTANADRISIGHLLVDNCLFNEAAVAIIDYALAGGPPAYVITPNAQHVVLLDEDMRLRKIYRGADLVVADGISLVLASRMFGHHIRERVAGVDLFQRLCSLAAERGLRVFLLGGRPGAAERAAAALQGRWPKLQIDNYCPPMGFEESPEETKRVADAVLAFQPHLLFVGFGAPKQERWIFEQGLRLGAVVSIGVGGSFEMVSGIVQRAPLWVQHIGCEWLYRLCMEPRRMWRRYLIGNARFCTIVLQQSVRKGLLSAFTEILRKQSFAAELLDPDVRTKIQELTNSLREFSSDSPRLMSDRHVRGL